MRKILILSFLVFSAFCSVKAEQLVLSDRIQQARDEMRMQEAKEKAKLAMMKPAFTKDCEKMKTLNEQSAAEKIDLYPNKDSE